MDFSFNCTTYSASCLRCSSLQVSPQGTYGRGIVNAYEGERNFDLTCMQSLGTQTARVHSTLFHLIILSGTYVPGTIYANVHMVLHSPLLIRSRPASVQLLSYQAGAHTRLGAKFLRVWKWTSYKAACDQSASVCNDSFSEDTS